MLDEVDKIGQDFRGDPMSALLEVLDPAQNFSFSDHYLALPFDLSNVFFIATANYMAAIQPALRDRMEVIEIGGYTHAEKLMIARRHLVPRQLTENGLNAEQLRVEDEVLSVIIEEYTREAGVRELEREIGSVCRARATAVVRGQAQDPKVTVQELRQILGPRQYESEVAAILPAPGVVTGLAFTPVGGEILFIETATMPGSGQLQLTGQLGDVMRESAMAATSLIRSRMGRRRARGKSGAARQLDFADRDIHVHVPSGATPKDGPSAGVAMLTAITSVLTGRNVDAATGMTGEITLSRRVLPVGGIRDKVLAAYRAGLKRVILPARNEQDLADVPQDVRNRIQFVFVRSVDELLAAVFHSQRRVNFRPGARNGERTGKGTPTSGGASSARVARRGNGGKGVRPRRTARRASRRPGRGTRRAARGR